MALHEHEQAARALSALRATRSGSLGRAPCAAGAVDRDGRADLAVGRRGYVRILSALDGSLIREYEGSGAVAEFGYAGAVRVFSGKTGKTLY